MYPFDPQPVPASLTPGVLQVVLVLLPWLLLASALLILAAARRA